MMQMVRVLLGLLSAALPLVEKYGVAVLPVTTRVRDGALPVAVLASLAAVAAGMATARQTGDGLTVGWLSLLMFVVTTVLLYGFTDYMPRAVSGLYVIFFASFTLSVSSFLSTRAPQPK